MTVADLMTREVATVAPDAPLPEVARLLVERGISAVPVVAPDGALLGVVSEADLLWKEGGEPSSRRGRRKANAQTAGEAMSSPALTVPENAAVADAARTMLDREVKRLMVVKSGQLVGIVSRSDLVRAFARSDDEIEREIVYDVVVRTHWIPPSNVEVKVSNGRVVLTGEVESKALADSVSHFVRRVPGVVSVDSRLHWPRPALNAP